MSNSYIIQWRSLVNGRTGKGSKLFQRSEAEQLAAELNREYPEIHHEVVPANTEPQGGSPGALGPEEKQLESETESLPPANPQVVHAE